MIKKGPLLLLTQLLFHKFCVKMNSTSLLDPAEIGSQILRVAGKILVTF